MKIILFYMVTTKNRPKLVQNYMPISGVACNQLKFCLVLRLVHSCSKFVLVSESGYYFDVSSPVPEITKFLKDICKGKIPQNSG